jgi:glycosyltransferase involved in cell wall biosynthesis
LIAADTLGGGMGALVRQHVEHAQMHFDVHLLAPGANHFQVLGAQTHDWSLPPRFASPRTIRASREFRALTRQLSVDIVHVHGLRSFWAVRPVQKAFVTLHGFGNEERASRRRIVAKRGALSFAARISSGAFSVMPLPNPRWNFIAHASPRLSQITPVAGLGSAATFVGSLNPPKRPEILIQAVQVADWKGPVNIVGGSADVARIAHLQQLADASSADVHLVGHVKDPMDYVDRSRVVVLASDFEGVPLVLQEAMWAGVPVVAPPLPGVRWLVGDEEGGLFATSASEVAAALRRLSDLDFAEQLGKAAHARVHALLKPGDPWDRIFAAY